MTHESLRPDQIDDAFHDAYCALWRAIEQRGISPAEQIADWTGCHPRTAYNWHDRSTTPSDWRAIYRLKMRSTSEGYLEMAGYDISGELRVAPVGEPLVNGTTRDELEELVQVCAELVAAENTNDGEAILHLTRRLHEITNRLSAQGEQWLGSGRTLRNVS